MEKTVFWGRAGEWGEATEHGTRPRADASGCNTFSSLRLCDSVVSNE